MSIKVMQEVWDNARVTQGTLLVLLSLADSADEKSRECWPAISTIAAKSRLSERQVQRCITELQEAGIVVVTANAGRSGSNLFRIQEVTKWRGDKMSGGDAHVTGGVTPMSPGGVTPMSPKPSLRTINEPSTRESDDDLFSAKSIETPKVDKAEEAFNRFWAVYPKKSGKPAAHRNFLRAVKAGADPETIIAAAERYASSDSVLRGFAKHPQGWLTDERWNDEDLTPRQMKPRGPAWGEVVR